jgi:signal transduction histidine kinase
LTAADNPPQVGSRHSQAGWEKITSKLTQSALQGESAHGTLEFGGRVYLVVAVPVFSSDRTTQAGALTVATRISETVLQDLKSLTGAEILLIAGNAITAASMHQSEWPVLPPDLVQIRTGNESRILPIEIHNEHYLALANSYEQRDQPGGFRYVLLSSYEQQLRERDRNRTTLLGISLAGILLSGFVVWLLIRRITHPLLELRDNAEAVGRGDFTRRITRFSDDECGAVAVAFNGMTDNLQASRADLEKAVGSLKTAQSQLIQSEKLSAVGQFVAGVAHELNNPLTSVIGFSDLLNHTDLDPKYKEYVDRISKSATRCHKIVNSLLGFSRQHEPERKPVQVNDLAEIVIDIIGYDLRTSNITLLKEYQPDLPVILGDSHQLQQVILNILSNARQALETFRRDGQIILRTGRTATHVWLRIRDNGPGITRENLAKIFDPFFTTKPQGKGTGLGLSLSYGIMQEHRGRIHAESQPGEGTEFILELPIAEQASAGISARAGTAVPMGENRRSLHVLVIDDEESILHLVEEVLKAEGHTVETASSGEAALPLIERNPYNVIICDWKMPGLSGIALFQELLQKNPAAAKRVLFMTGDVIKENFQEFMHKHGRTCLSKPFALREFHLAIARMLDPA